SPSCDVCAVSDLDDLDDLLHSEAFDAVVAEWEEHLLDRIQASQPGVRLIHCGDSLPEAGIEAARRGVEVSHVDKPEELKARVTELTRSRSWMLRQRLSGFSVRYAGSPTAHRLLELSNDGLAFAIDGEQELKPLLPGTALEDLEISSGSQLLLLGGSATLPPLPASPP